MIKARKRQLWKCPHPPDKVRWDRVKDSTGIHFWRSCKRCGRLLERRRCP